MADRDWQAQLYPAAFKHFELALARSARRSRRDDQVVARSLQANPAISPWLKQPYSLLEAARRAGRAAAGPVRRGTRLGRRRALGPAAASAFELLSADPVAAPAADRNLGLCRLWLGDERGGREGPAPLDPAGRARAEAVDLAVVCQLLDESTDREPIEQVRLSWQIRDREALLRGPREPTRGRRQARARHLDPDDEESPEVACLPLARPAQRRAQAGAHARRDPADPGRDPGRAARPWRIETPDDGRLNGLIDRFTALAGKAIPPAHPRTKVIGRTSPLRARPVLALVSPARACPRTERQRLNQEQIAHIMTTVWPDTPMDYLGGKTPRQAARSGQFQVPLRAAVLQMQLSEDEWGEKVDWAAFRAGLGIEPEPAIDPHAGRHRRGPPGQARAGPGAGARRRTPGQALSPGPRVGARRAGRRRRPARSSTAPGSPSG